MQTDSFEEIYRKSSGLVVFVLRKLRVPEAELEEMVQEVFLRFWKRQETIEAGKANAWLTTTARNLAFDRYDSQKRRRTDTDSEAVGRAESAMWVSEPHLDSRIDEVRAAIEEHSARTGNDLLTLFYLDELPVKVIAERKGLAVSSVTSSLSRQRKDFNAKLRVRLDALDLT